MSNPLNHSSRSTFRIFLLSPARLTGKRAGILLSRRANFDLANRLQNHGAPLGEVFSFMSGLYFRGKLAYANHFARPPAGLPGALIITSNRGLLPAETTITPEELRSFSDVYIDASEIRYVQPLTDSAMKILKTLPGHSDVVLLGSISTEKYAGPLLEIFDARLKFPVEFVGRGDMSRGGLMLRSIEAGQELEYVSLAGSSRHGKRPPKLEPRRRS